MVPINYLIRDKACAMRFIIMYNYRKRIYDTKFLLNCSLERIVYERNFGQKKHTKVSGETGRKISHRSRNSGGNQGAFC